MLVEKYEQTWDVETILKKRRVNLRALIRRGCVETFFGILSKEKEEKHGVVNLHGFTRHDIVEIFLKLLSKKKK